LANLLLLVEDEELVLVTVETALQDAGYAVRSARGGAEAMGLLDADAETFCALVTDVNLGDVDGWQVARRARELKPTLPVVFVTGDSAHEWASQGVPHSVLVEKPFAPAQIVTAVSNLLNVTDISPLR
jgi:DNA-binding response OmpR family regulator